MLLISALHVLLGHFVFEVNLDYLVKMYVVLLSVHIGFLLLAKQLSAIAQPGFIFLGGSMIKVIVIGLALLLYFKKEFEMGSLEIAHLAIAYFILLIVDLLHNIKSLKSKELNS